MARRMRRLQLPPPAGGLFGTVTRVETRRPAAALTFDDGPHPVYTPRLLDILERHGAHATFFMVGENAQRHPELVRRVSEAGHAIGNHSWDHPSFPLISRRERRDQIQRCAAALVPHGSPLFRPPYGMQDVASRLDAGRLGYSVIAWSVTSDDWCGGDAAAVAGQIESALEPGCIVVLHDRLVDVEDEAYFDRQPLIEAVDLVLGRMRARFEFVTVPELLAMGRPRRELWIKPANRAWLNGLRREEGPGPQYAEDPFSRSA
jgi:peptidoglycan/xylan/chitin deacetylase (PgdA/CDA1 family)